MVLIILKNVAVSLRGELSRWLLEPSPGVFIGHVNTLVRDKLWEKCCQKCQDGGVFQAWNTNNEQNFSMRTYGDVHRELVDLEGILLLKTT